MVDFALAPPAGKKAEEQQENRFRSELCPLLRMPSMQHIAIIEEDAFHRHAHDEYPHIPSFCVSLEASVPATPTPRKLICHMPHHIIIWTIT